MKKYILIIIIISSIVACKNTKEVSSSDTSVKKEVIKSENKEATIKKEKDDYKSQTAKAAKNLIGKHWKLIELNGIAVEMSENMKEPHLKFSEGNQISGHGGCNSFFGTYNLENSRFLNFSGIGMTEMACSFENYDKSFIKLLSTPTEFLLIGEDELRFQIGKRMPHAKFKAIYL